MLGTIAGFENRTGSDNVLIGRGVARNNQSGNTNVMIGTDAGRDNISGSGNVFLGHQTGLRETGSNKLYIDNSNTLTPLIKGDFERDIVTVNGALGVGIENPERPIHLRATNAIFRIDRDRNDPGFAIVRYDEGFNNIFKSFYFYNRAIGPNNGKFIIADWGRNVAGPSTPRLVIANNGNVGIGNFLTTNPSQKLTVDGSVLATGSFITSDKRFKKDIKVIPQAMESLENISGVSYTYQTEKFEKRSLPTGKSMGLIAQEVQKVYPELVNEDEEGYLSVNYDGLIPVLIEALKEQKAHIQKLESKVNQLENNTIQNQEDSPENQITPILHQNEPNPFDQSTVIKMYLPESVEQASLYIYTMQGQALKHIRVNERGNTQIEVTKNTLSAGMYLYALIVDNQEVDVKRMILR